MVMEKKVRHPWRASFIVQGRVSTQILVSTGHVARSSRPLPSVDGCCAAR